MRGLVIFNQIDHTGFFCPQLNAPVAVSSLNVSRSFRLEPGRTISRQARLRVNWHNAKFW